MKKIVYTILTAALAVGILAGGLMIDFGRAQPDTQAVQPAVPGEPMHTVSVNGTGLVSASPDQAIVSLGVLTEAESAQEALQANNEQMQDVLEALTDAGIASEDIQTQTIRLQPRYQSPDEGQPRELVGYTATNVVEVTVRELDNLGEALDAAVSAGGNTIENIRFDISDASELLDQAREAAMNDARHKAEQLATLADASLGAVLSINESSRVPVPLGLGGAPVAQEQAAVPIEPGTQDITVDVQVTWLLQVGQDEPVGAAPSVSISPTSGPPGTELEVNASGFPPNTQVEIGVGRRDSEYDVAARESSDDEGALSTSVEIPSFAESGEEWVVVVALTEAGVLGPNEKATSNVFEVTE